MNKTKFYTLSTLLLISVGFSGCAKNSETGNVKTAGSNQAAATAANNSANQTAAAVPTDNNSAVSAAPPVSTTIANAASAPAVADKDKKPLPAAGEPKPQIGSGASDMFVFTEARSALASDTELLNGVIMEIKEGSVTLTGKVSSEAQKAKAAKLVSGVKGIKSVKNNLRVAS